LRRQDSFRTPGAEVLFCSLPEQFKTFFVPEKYNPEGFFVPKINLFSFVAIRCYFQSMILFTSEYEGNNLVVRKDGGDGGDGVVADENWRIFERDFSEEQRNWSGTFTGNS
jgi:hypothetical protein